VLGIAIYKPDLMIIAFRFTCYVNQYVTVLAMLSENIARIRTPDGFVFTTDITFLEFVHQI
jgi:hypothetical protein